MEPKISGEIRSGRAIPTDEEPDDLTKTSDFFDALFAGEGTDIQNAQTRSQLLLEIFEDYGWETARRLLLHYMDGTGEPVTVSPEVLGQYPTVRRSYVDVLRYFTEWLVGERSDSKHGTPELPLRDGDKLTIGVPPGHYQKDLDHLIMWEANFSSVAETGHPAALRALGSESHAVFGSAMLQGFANSLVLVREGDLIKITGDMTFRVNDIYDFSEGDMFGLRKLEEAGLARSFGVTTEIWRVEVEGFIKFEDGNPIRAQIHLVDYQDVAGGVDHRPVDFAARRRIR